MEERRKLGIKIHGQHYDDVLKQVIADMEKRRELGIEIYGEPVKVGSFKSKLYLYEEILDSAAYLKTDILSGPSLDDYQSTVPADDCRYQLLILAQNLNASSDNLQNNLALALRYIAAIAKSHDIRLSQLSD
ncbi:hypothetical protein [Laspinema olomoucense]|uniref:Uncharacterized protein n=1 Tax=Laspinema olomoucense D3b TaxID=2953688 RepID=A0ABT2N4G7_9CYAN|nr:hypothetical protein [Laspinema sp. D3b]MCT7977547.1 hypothetical protein [Laspinema sp. D3b]